MDTPKSPLFQMSNNRADTVGHPLSNNWLQVSGTAERSQLDQRVRHQLHAIVPLLDAFKTEQQPLELIFPRKGPLDPHA